MEEHYLVEEQDDVLLIRYVGNCNNGKAHKRYICENYRKYDMSIANKHGLMEFYERLIEFAKVSLYANSRWKKSEIKMRKMDTGLSKIQYGVITIDDDPLFTINKINYKIWADQ